MLKARTLKVVVLGGAAVAVGVVAYRAAFRHRRRVALLINQSKWLHHADDHDGSVAAAKEAYELATTELRGSASHRRAQLNLAGVYHAINAFDDALLVLRDETTSVTDGNHLVSLLHARAEVLEAAEKPLSLAGAELSRARELRREIHGPRSMDAAFAALNLARTLVRQSQESVPVSDPRLEARISLMHGTDEILALLEQAEALAFEAHTIALAAGEADRAAEFISEMIELITASDRLVTASDRLVTASDGTEPAEQGQMGVEATVERLAAAYQKASGELWTKKRAVALTHEGEQQKDGEQKDVEQKDGDQKDAHAPMPVSVLSGFLGAGKTTLLTHLLNNQEGCRIAIIVNDMASVNVDAELVRSATGRGSTVIEKMVELSNGCICCTLREDLLTSLSALAAERRFDHVLVESSGISEPLPVAETFTYADEDTGVQLSDVASLSNLVTVVDAASIFEQLATVDKLVDRGWQAADDDDRTVAHLLIDQLEFSDLILLNKTDLVSGASCDTIEALIRRWVALPLLSTLLSHVYPHFYPHATPRRHLPTCHTVASSPHMPHRGFFSSHATTAAFSPHMPQPRPFLLICHTAAFSPHMPHALFRIHHRQLMLLQGEPER